MVKITVVCDIIGIRGFLNAKRAIQMWLTQLDMISIQRYFEGYIDNRVIKAWWLD